MTALPDPARLAAVDASGLLELTEEERRPFDRLARIAGAQLDVPVAAVTVLDAEHQTLVAAHGSERFTCDAEDSVCRHVVRSGRPQAIADTRLHPAHGPDSFAARHGAIAYAGVPLRDAAGQILGALCAIGGDAREWTPAEIGLLEELSAIGTAELVLRETAARALRTQLHMTAVVESALDAIVTMDADGLVTEFNPAAERMFGYPRSFAVGKRLSELIIPPALRPAHGEALTRNLATGEKRILDQRLQLEAVRSDGSPFPVELTVTRTGTGPRPFYTGFVRDLSERRAAERALGDTKARLALTVEAAPMVLFALDAEGRLTICEGSALEAWGINPEGALGRSAFDFYAGDPDFLAALRGALAGEAGELTHRIGDVVLETRFRPLVEGDRVTGVAGVALDVTERLSDQARIAELAYVDRLTRLPNRVWLEEHVDRALGDGGSAADRTAALLFVDLDDFQAVNDSLGHVAADEVLREVAARLSALLGDSGRLARQSADEFLLFLEDLGADPRAGAERYALEVVAALEAPFAVDDFEFQVDASVGISLLPAHGDEFAELLRAAESALQHAKRSAGTRLAVHRRDDEGARRRLTMRARLRRALAEQHFVLHYQPIFDLATGRVSALEALLRWEDPVHGRIPPLDFIGLAETTGLIVPIGEWVAEEACRQQCAWDALGLRVGVGFNVSPVQVGRGDFPDRLAGALARTGADVDRLIVEITESTALDDNGINPEIARLKDLGVSVVIDDFGAGHSSLTRLRGLDVDGLKLDRALLTGVPEDPGACAVVTATLALCHALDIRSVAEGIETEDQRAYIAAGGCTFGQGFGLARPMDAEQATAFLRSPAAGLEALPALERSA